MRHWKGGAEGFINIEGTSDESLEGFADTLVRLMALQRDSVTMKARTSMRHWAGPKVKQTDALMMGLLTDSQRY